MSGNGGETKAGSVTCVISQSGCVDDANGIDDDGAQGWSLSVTADNLSITGITTAGTDIDVPPFVPLDFNVTEISNPAKTGNRECAANGNKGAISAVVLRLTEALTLGCNATKSIAQITVECSIPPEPAPVDLVGTVRYADGCQGFSQPRDNIVTERGNSVLPTTRGTVNITCYRIPTPHFHRGDANADGTTDISDAITILGRLFLGTSSIPCGKAADVNDDGSLDISDAVYLLSFKFLGGPPPPEPSMSCGTDRTPDDLTCEEFKPCATACFSDDFSQVDALRNWTVHSGDWSIASGELETRTAEGGESWIWAGNPPVPAPGNGGYSLKARFKAGQAPDGVGRHGGVMLCAANSTDRGDPHNRGYTVDWIDRQGDLGMRLSRWDSGVENALDTGTPQLADPPSVWQITLDSQTISVYGDGKLLLQAQDSTYRGGYFGAWAWIDQTLDFDEVRFLGDCR